MLLLCLFKTVLATKSFFGHQGIGTDYVWFTEDLSHSAARAIERELSGGRSKAAAGLNRNMLPTRETAGRHEEYSTILNSLPNSLEKNDGDSKSCNSFERIGGISNITIITWIGTLGP